MTDFKTWLEATNASLGTSLESKELADFVSQNTMSFEGLELAYDREGDFFKLYEKQNTLPFVIYSRNKVEEIDVLGVFAIREILINGMSTPYLYTSDFRVDKEKVNPRNLVAFRKVYKKIINEYKTIKEFSHLDNIFTCILAGNEAAIKIFTKGKGGIHYHFVKNYYSYICPVLPFYKEKESFESSLATLDELIGFYDSNHDGYLSEILLKKIEQNYKDDPSRFMVTRLNGEIIAACYLSESHGRKLVLHKKSLLIKSALFFINFFRKNKIKKTIPMIYLKLLRFKKGKTNIEKEIQKLILQARNKKLLHPGDLVFYSSSEKLKKNFFLDVETEGNLYKVSGNEHETNLPIGPSQKIFLEISEL